MRTMKIKIFFLISAMNALSYLCFGNCCENCCGDCCGDCGEEGFGKENIKENFFLEEKNTDEEIKKEEIKNFVNEKWLKKGEDNVKFKIYEEKKERNKGGDIEVIKYINGKIRVKKIKLGTNTHKWALFEIKYKEEGKEEKTVYLYCSDIESTENDSFIYGIFEDKNDILNISVLACDTSKVTDMSSMFFNCSSLETLDLFNFNTSKVTDMSYMFNNCNKLNKVIVSKDENTKNKIFEILSSLVGDWEEEKNNIKENICTLTKVEEEE